MGAAIALLLLPLLSSLSQSDRELRSLERQAKRYPRVTEADFHEHPQKASARYTLSTGSLECFTTTKNKAELIDAIALKAQVPKKMPMLCNALEVVIEAVPTGDKVTLMGCGTFESRERQVCEGRNPSTASPFKFQRPKCLHSQLEHCLKKKSHQSKLPVKIDNLGRQN